MAWTRRACLVLGWRRRLQEVHRWWVGWVVLGEGHSQSKFLTSVDSAFCSADGDNPHSNSDANRQQELFMFENNLQQLRIMLLI